MLFCQYDNQADFVQALFFKLTGRGNQVVPAVESSSSSESAEAAPAKPQHSYWSDSDYSTEPSPPGSTAGDAAPELTHSGR